MMRFTVKLTVNLNIKKLRHNGTWYNHNLYFLHTCKYNLLSCVLLGAGGLRVAQLVLICRPPNHWPPICTIAFSASYKEKKRATRKQNKQNQM